MIARSHVTLAIIGAVVIALGVIIVSVPSRRLPPPTAFTLQCWHWGAARTPAPDELAAVAALPIADLCWWCGSVTIEDGAPRFRVRGGRPAGWAGRSAWAVVRVEPSCAHLLVHERAAVRAAIGQGLERARAGGPLSGLQIDWDVPTRRLDTYAALLRELRPDLPAGCGLSCTGLVAWLDAAEVDAVVAAVDWWVPQCYSTDVPERADLAGPLVCRVPPGPVAARCAQLARPFRIGLPTFEQASLWSADGRLIAAALPLACEDAIAAGLAVVGAPEGAVAGGERVLRFTAPRAAVIAGRSIPAGAHSGDRRADGHQPGRADRGGARAGRAVVRRRQPLPAAQSRRAALPDARAGGRRVAGDRHAAGGGRHVDVERRSRWRLDPGHRQPRARGLGGFRGAGAARGGGHGHPGGGPAAMTVLPAVDGVPCGPAHATGVLVVVPFLRAGGMVSLAFPGQAAPPTCVALAGKDP